MALVALQSGGLAVRGTATCPSPAEVAESLEPLMPADRRLPPGVVLHVDAGAEPAEIELRMESDDDPTPFASRRLPRLGSCRELAEAAAVVAASWAGRYDTPAPAKVAPWDTTSGPPGVVRREATPVEAPARAWSIGATGGLDGASAGGATAHGGVELTAALGRTRWFGRVQVAGTGERWFPVDAGTAAWWRLLVIPSVGAAWGGPVFLEASAGPVLGPVFVRGRGFSPNAKDVSLDLGVCPSLRLGYRFGPSARVASVWLGASAVAWLRPHRVAVDMSPNGASIPRLDVMIGLGASFALGI